MKSGQNPKYEVHSHQAKKKKKKVSSQNETF